MEIEVLRNKPPGARCNTLVENLMEAVAEVIDDLDSELTIKITFSKEAKAPALKINREIVGENLSMEEIVENFSSEALSKRIIELLS